MKNLRKMDKTLLVLIIIYCLFGLIMIFSASSASTVLKYGTASTHFFVRQLIALIAGFFVGFLILLIPTKYQKMTTYILTAGVTILLFVVLVKGTITNNAQSWFNIGPFKVQPSEFAKTMIILYMAFFYSTLQRNKMPFIMYFIPAILAAVMTLLIAKQPDWGSAIILILISFFCFLEVPFIKKNKKTISKIILIGAAILAVFGSLFINEILTDEKKSRITQFSNPCERYQDDTGYQVCNGFIAIANGGLFGVGLGQSSQKYLYLPESHTDFIFPIICEECGAIVGSLIILGYGFILLRILKIAKKADNVRNRIIAYGTFWYFCLHILINLLGILALIPLTGVPLPFLTYGGSYTLNALILLFFTERVAIENKTNQINRQIASI